MTNNKQQHESYGMLQFARTTNGKDTVLFGSSIPHRETIRLRIAPGLVERNLNHDNYYAASQPYIEVEMSQAQFAEAITSMNMGSGVPVTIRRVNGKGIEPADFTNKRLQFEEEFTETMKQLEARMNQLTEQTEDILTNKKTISKADKQTIQKQIYELKQEVRSNIPFMLSQFNEQLDKTTMQAKMEVEAFTLSKINQLGLQKLDELNHLTNNPSLTLIEQSDDEN